MEVDTRFEAKQTGIPLRIAINSLFSNYPTLPFQEDVVVDAVGKERQLCRHIPRREVESQVGLQTVLRC